MAKTDAGSIRNVAVLAHGNAGKTILVESMLLNAGEINRLGSIEEGTTVTDFEPEEIKRQISISSALAHCNWKDIRFNLIDTPGFINLLEDSRGSMRATDGVVVVGSAISGIKGETEKLWQYAEEFNLPKLVFINKMDKEGADFNAAVKSFEKSFKLEAIPLMIPIGAEDKFIGTIDILSMKAYTYDDTGKATECEIPEDMAAEVDEARKKLVEKVAESDDALLEKYLEDEKLSDEELRKGIKDGSLKRKFIPLLCGVAPKSIGVPELMDYIIMCLPSPLEAAALNPIKGKDPKTGEEVTREPSEEAPLSVFIFKTVADPFAGKLSMFRVYSGTLKADTNYFNTTNDTKERVGQIFQLQGKKHDPAQILGPGDIGVVAKLKGTNTGDTLCADDGHIVFDKVTFAEPLIAYAIEPRSKGDEDKVSTGLHKILDEDPTLKFTRDEEANEMQLAGMGQIHLEITLEKLKRKFGVDVEMKTPKIPYRETIKKTAEARHRHKKQSGGKGQFGECEIRIEPVARGNEYEFVDKIVGGSIPKQFIPAVDKGIKETLKKGVFSGHPMVDVKVTLFDGSYHAVDSSEMAFKIAGSMAIKKAVEAAKPILLEPVMKMLITIPEEALGTVIGDLNTRRGKVQGMDPAPGGKQKISAMVPMAEVLTYSNQLHSMTAGRGVFIMELERYEEVPGNITQKIIKEEEEARAEK